MEEYSDYELHSPEAMFHQGMDLLESDHFDEAVHAFDHVLTEQPYNADALFHRGVALINLSRLDEAVASFERAIALAPTEALFHSHCGYALLMGGKSEAALEKFEYALELQPDSYQNKVYKACVLAERRKLGEARNLLEEVLQEHPDDLEVVRHYANILAAQGNEQEALEQYGSILKKNPNHLEAISRRGAIFLRQGNREDGIRCLREYLALSPSDERAWNTLLETMTELNQREAVIAAAGEAIETGVESCDVYMFRGRALLDERQYDSAITDLRRARTLNERSGEVHFLLARAFAERGRLKHALLSVNRALQITPREKRSMLLKARLHHQLSEYEQEWQLLTSLLADAPEDYRLVKLKIENLLARHLLAEASVTVDSFLALAPTHRRALLVSAELNERIGNLAVARSRYDYLFSNQPVSARAYVAFGGFLMRRGEITQSDKFLQEGVKQFPTDVGLSLLHAVVLQMLERHQQCLDGLRVLMDTAAVPAEIHWLLGKSHYALHEYVEALRHFQTARQLGAGSAGVQQPLFRCLLSEAYSLHHLGRTVEGIQLLEEQWEGQGTYVREYHEALSELYLHTRAYAKAALLCNKGLEHCADSPLLHYQLAQADAGLNRKPAMLRHLAAALQLQPKLLEKACTEPLFQQYGLSFHMNRLVKWAFLRERLEFAGWVLLATVSCVAIAMWLRS